jgi:hypothetical protein
MNRSAGTTVPSGILDPERFLGLVERGGIAVALAPGELGRDAPEPDFLAAEGIDQIDAADVPVAIEDLGLTQARRRIEHLAPPHPLGTDAATGRNADEKRLLAVDLKEPIGLVRARRRVGEHQPAILAADIAPIDPQHPPGRVRHPRCGERQRGGDRLVLIDAHRSARNMRGRSRHRR